MSEILVQHMAPTSERLYLRWDVELSRDQLTWFSSALEKMRGVEWSRVSRYSAEVDLARHITKREAFVADLEALVKHGCIEVNVTYL